MPKNAFFFEKKIAKFWGFWSQSPVDLQRLRLCPIPP